MFGMAEALCRSDEPTLFLLQPMTRMMYDMNIFNFVP